MLHRRTWLSLIIVLLTGYTLSAQSNCHHLSVCEQEDNPEYGLSTSEINAIPVVELERLQPDETLMYDRSYSRLNNAVMVYDSPGGTPVRTIAPGFNFVTVLSGDEDGWTRINIDEWVRTEQLTATTDVVSSFTGFFLPDVLPDYAIAWALIDMYPSTEPGGDPCDCYDEIERYTPLRIYTNHVVAGIRWYQVGPARWVHQYHVSKVTPLTEKPEDVDTELWISVDLYEQNLVVYEDMKPIFTTLVATGLPRWPTREGTFKIFFRNPREHMTWGTVGDDYYVLEEVPWTMFFDYGRALHGAYWHDGFGYRRSHGCVNMTITDAHWLYQRVAEEMGGTQRSPDIEEDGVVVHVYSSGRYR